MNRKDLFGLPQHLYRGYVIERSDIGRLDTFRARPADGESGGIYADTVEELYVAIDHKINMKTLAKATNQEVIEAVRNAWPDIQEAIQYLKDKSPAVEDEELPKEYRGMRIFDNYSEHWPELKQLIDAHLDDKGDEG